MLDVNACGMFRRTLKGCRGSGVEHPLGKGEVESSNLSGSTINFNGLVEMLIRFLFDYLIDV